MPELIKSGQKKAVAPGSEQSSATYFSHSRIIKNPGSEIVGVPASQIKAKRSPDFNLLTYFAKTSCSL